MRTIFTISFILIFAVSFASANETDDPIPTDTTIEFTNHGINLYGKFRFESEGELFDIIDSDSKILISAGAVLTCIRRTYTIGYFGGGATITEEEGSHVIPKVFFILKPSGKITFHSPTPDGNFPGKQLPDTIEFGQLHDPTKK